MLDVGHDVWTLEATLRADDSGVFREATGKLSSFGVRRARWRMNRIIAAGFAFRSALVSCLSCREDCDNDCEIYLFIYAYCTRYGTGREDCEI